MPVTAPPDVSEGLCKIKSFCRKSKRKGLPMADMRLFLVLLRKKRTFFNLCRNTCRRRADGPLQCGKAPAATPRSLRSHVMDYPQSCNGLSAIMRRGRSGSGFWPKSGAADGSPHDNGLLTAGQQGTPDRARSTLRQGKDALVAERRRCRNKIARPPQHERNAVRELPWNGGQMATDRPRYPKKNNNISFFDKFLLIILAGRDFIHTFATSGGTIGCPPRGTPAQNGATPPDKNNNIETT